MDIFKKQQKTSKPQTSSVDAASEPLPQFTFLVERPGGSIEQIVGTGWRFNTTGQVGSLSIMAGGKVEADRVVFSAGQWLSVRWAPIAIQGEVSE